MLQDLAECEFVETGTTWTCALVTARFQCFYIFYQDVRSDPAVMGQQPVKYSPVLDEYICTVRSHRCEFVCFIICE